MSKLTSLIELWLKALGLRKKPDVNLLLFSLSWGLLNSLIGLVIGSFCILALGAYTRQFKKTVLVNCPSLKTCFGMTIGQVIVCSANLDECTLKHEYGHFKQSVILGPFYLFIVGLPSFLRACFYCLKNRPESAEEYFYFYTEAWADHLGGIYAERKHKCANWWNYLFRARM